MGTSYQWSRRKGTTAQHSTFVGINGEITVDTDKNTVVVHDGVKAGGYPLAKEETLSQIASNMVTLLNTVDELANASGSINAVAIVSDLDRGGTFIWSATGTANGGTVFAGATGYWNRQYSGVVNVKWFGAKGDGVTDDSQAFINAYAYIKSKIDTSPTGNKRGTVKLYIPAGKYLITQPKALMDDAGMRVAGLTIEGEGRRITQIIFAPTNDGSDKYLIENSDDWLHITIKDLSFIGDGNASFMLSTSNGGAQQYIFERVNWWLSHGSVFIIAIYMVYFAYGNYNFC